MRALSMVLLALIVPPLAAQETAIPFDVKADPASYNGKLVSFTGIPAAPTITKKGTQITPFIVRPEGKAISHVKAVWAKAQPDLGGNRPNVNYPITLQGMASFKRSEGGGGWVLTINNAERIEKK